MRNALLDAVEVARQMQTLVTTLLSLVRSEQMPPVVLETISLRSFVERSLNEPVLNMERDRVVLTIPPDACVMAEPHLLSSILRNVLSNAFEYSVPDSSIHVTAARDGKVWSVSIENQTDRLAAGDLPHLFEPFWRKDAARHNTVHAGLGLSLVSAYCRISGIAIDTMLNTGDIFTVRLVFSESVSPDDGAPGERPSFAHRDTIASSHRVHEGSPFAQ